MCCSPWDCTESDMTEQLNRTELKPDTDSEAGRDWVSGLWSEGGGGFALERQRKLRHSAGTVEFLQYSEGWESERRGEKESWWSFHKRRMLTGRDGGGFPAFSFPHDGVSCSFSSFLVQPLPTYSFRRGTQFAFILTASQPEFRCRDKGHKSPCLGSDW